MRVLKGGREDRLDEGLAGLEVFAADGRVHLAGEFVECGDINGEVGAPLANGIPSFSAAHAYIMEGEMPGSLSTRPFSKASRVWWTAVCSRKISVDPHQIMIWRSVLGLELGDVRCGSGWRGRTCSCRS